MSTENPPPLLPPRAWDTIKLGTIRRLVEFQEYGPEITDPARIAPSTLTRDMDRLEKAFEGYKLFGKSTDQNILTPVGKLLASAYQPAIALCERLSAREINALAGDRNFRIASGGSLACWLIGPRINKIRKNLNHYHSFEDHPDEPKINVSVLRNRVTVANVHAGALECGLVREGVLDKRYSLNSEFIGIVKYCLYVPIRLAEQLRLYGINLSDYEDESPLPDQVERRILETGPVATVGKEGEFWLQLHGRLKDLGIIANIELLYRAFPMLIPHMLQESHVVIAPNIAKLGGVEPPGYRKFKLGIFMPSAGYKGYVRPIHLVASRDFIHRTKWFDFDGLTETLKFDM